MKQWSRHLILFVPNEERENIDKTQRNENVKWNGLRDQEMRVRESVMQGEGISTPHIHRTRWDPFSSKHVCVFKIKFAILLLIMCEKRNMF